MWTKPKGFKNQAQKDEDRTKLRQDSYDSGITTILPTAFLRACLKNNNEKKSNHICQNSALPFYVADCFVKPVFERKGEIWTAFFPAQTLSTGSFPGAYMFFKQLLLIVDLLYALRSHFKHGSPHNQDVSPPSHFLPPSPPLPSSAVQHCSFKVFLREYPASSCQAMLCCGNMMEH